MGVKIDDWELGHGDRRLFDLESGLGAKVSQWQVPFGLRLGILRNR
jgi:hypothetical protein